MNLILVDSPTELTTAATDVLLAGLAIIFAVNLATGWTASRRCHHWTWLFAFLAAGSLLGAAAHAFRMEKASNDLLWLPIYFLLGLTLVLLALAALFDWRGPEAAARARRWLLPLPLLVVAVTWSGRGEYIWFLLFEAAFVFFVLGIYLRLVLAGVPGARPILGGILLTLAAAFAQATGPYHLTLVWTFDHNGLYHLIQIPGLLLFYCGARQPAARHGFQTSPKG